MESIFHEKQDGSLCAQHCLNALLQGEYFTAVELATLAQQMDEVERQHMAEAGLNSEEYKRFLQQPSSNMDDSGYFSIQVIASALEVWSLELIPYNSQHPSALEANASPINQTAFICNYRDHWFTVRKLGKQWFNLNSLLTGPELISDTYLAMFLAQLQQEGYSIFIVRGFLPECEADNLLRLVPVVQLVKPRLLAEVRAQQDDQSSNTSVALTADKEYTDNIPEDEDHQLDEAVKLSLQEYQSNGQPTTSEKCIVSDFQYQSKMEQERGKTSGISGTVHSDHNSTLTLHTNNQTHQNSSPLSIDDLSEEAMLEAALKMSMEQETG